MLVERVVEPEPCACDKCGGLRLHKLGEVASKTLECEPRRWKIIERLREKFACRDCNGVTEPPAPSHPIPRGFAGPSRLAMILVGKFADHQPLNRQSAAFAREGVEIGASTLADWVGACIVALDPVLAESPRHLLAAERPHVDDTTVPVLAKTKTRTGRLWAYLRDDRPFGGADLLRPYVRNRGRRAAFGPTRAAAECCGLLTFRAHSRSAEVSIDVGLIGLPFVTADSAPHSTATWCYSPVVVSLRLASVRPSCSNVLYPARATRNKINGLRDSASWMGLLAPQPELSNVTQCVTKRLRALSRGFAFAPRRGDFH